MNIDFEKAENGTLSKEEIIVINEFIKKETFTVTKHAIEMFFTRYLNSYAMAFQANSLRLDIDLHKHKLPKLIKSYNHFKEVYNLYGWSDFKELSLFVNTFLTEHGECKALTNKETKFYKIRDSKRENKTLKIVAEPIGMFVKFVFIIDVKSKTIITVEILHTAKSSETLNSTKSVKEEVDYFFHHNTFEQDLKNRFEILTNEDYCKYPKEANNKEIIFNYLFYANISISEYIANDYIIKIINNMCLELKELSPEVEKMYILFKSSKEEKISFIKEKLKNLKIKTVTHHDVKSVNKKTGLFMITENYLDISLTFDLDNNTLIKIKANKNNIPYFSEKVRNLLYLGNDVIRGVQIIILNYEGKLLIAKRSKYKKNGELRIGAERWNFIGGKLDSGETPKMAAKRETFEESRIQLDDIKFLNESMNNWDPLYDPFYAYLFAGQIKKDTEVILNDEHTEYKFVSFNELDDYNLLGYSRNELIDIIMK